MAGVWIREAQNGGASVVFVHGILSSGEQCWQHENGTYWPNLVKNDPDFKSLGIYVYSYQTNISSGSYSLSDVVDDLKVHLLTLHKVVLSNTLIFVCHSMGGIVVRKFLVERVQDLLDHNIAVGLYLVASPSLGSKYANWLAPIAKFAGHSQAKALQFSQSNQWLNDLDKTFKNLKESGRLTIYGRELLEDKSLILKKIIRNQIVPPVSGACYFGESIKIAGSDHCSIAKPHDNQALQHTLLMAFLRKILPEQIHSNTAQSVPSQVASSKQLGEDDSSSDNPAISDISEQLEHWQIKLRSNLTEQLKCADLNAIVDDFIGRLLDDNANLSKNTETIANYLVTGNGDRHRQIAQFLSAVSAVKDNQQSQSKARASAVEQMLAYLLQTLVRQYKHENDHGLTQIPVENIQTAELVGASRTSTPHIPDYAKQGLEHKNGQRNSRFEYIGDYLPVEGECNEEVLCEKIAANLLITLGYPETTHSKDCLQRLSDYLSAFSDAPENAPLQALYSKKDDTHNPLHVDCVAE